MFEKSLKEFRFAVGLYSCGLFDIVRWKYVVRRSTKIYAIERIIIGNDEKYENCLREKQKETNYDWNLEDEPTYCTQRVVRSDFGNESEDDEET